MSDWVTDNIFKGTSWYYARYRPDYPDELIKLLTNKFNLNKTSRVLDLGCGTGIIALQLSPFVAEVVAIDPLNEMLQEGQLLAARKGITNIKWFLGKSGKIISLSQEIGAINLAVMANSFHWMNRKQILHDLYPVTIAGGGLAVISAYGPKAYGSYSPDTEWKVIVSDTIKFWMGDVRKAGTKGTYTHPDEKFETVLAESRFHGLESYTFKTKRTWTLDSIVGHLYSTSSTSIPVLGDKKEPFEADLRKRLSELEPSGIFYEDAITEALILWK